MISEATKEREREKYLLSGLNIRPLGVDQS